MKIEVLKFSIEVYRLFEKATLLKLLVLWPMRLGYVIGYKVSQMHVGYLKSIEIDYLHL
jgi:hypothetical protein